MFPRPIASREEGKIFRIGTCPAGRLVAVVMDTLDGEIRLRDALTLAPKGTLLLGATRTVRACAIGPDSQSLYVAATDRVEAYTIGEGKPRWSVDLMGEDAAIAISPDGARLAVGAGTEGIVVMSTEDGSQSAAIAVAQEPRALAWDASGLVAIDAGTLRLFDDSGAKTAELDVAPRGDEAFELCLMGTAVFAIAGTSSSGVWVDLRDRSTGAATRTLRFDGDRRAEGLAYSARVLFASSDAGTYRVDPPYEQPVRWLPPMGGSHDPTRLAHARDGHVIVSSRDLRVYRTRS